MTPDCKSCGACCTPPMPPPHLVHAEWGHGWADVLPDDKARLDRRAVRRLVVVDSAHGIEAIRTAPARQVRGPLAGQTVTACAALRGSLLARVSCRIYATRPDACRTFTPGGVACLATRARVRALSEGSPPCHS